MDNFLNSQMTLSFLERICSIALVNWLVTHHHDHHHHHHFILIPQILLALSQLGILAVTTVTQYLFASASVASYC
jgi:uncharacterized protein YjfI (DUF2170 family)